MPAVLAMSSSVTSGGGSSGGGGRGVIAGHLTSL